MFNATIQRAELSDGSLVYCVRLSNDDGASFTIDTMGEHDAERLKESLDYAVAKYGNEIVKGY